MFASSSKEYRDSIVEVATFISSERVENRDSTDSADFHAIARDIAHSHVLSLTFFTWMYIAFNLLRDFDN